MFSAKRQSIKKYMMQKNKSFTQQQSFQNQEEPSDFATVTVIKEGPLMVEGKVKIQEAFLEPNEDGFITEYHLGKEKSVTQKKVALCRCGKSKNKPFCDAAHTQIRQGSCTAPHEPILTQAEQFKGPDLTLHDNEKYCAFARFCDGYGRIWNLVRQGTAFANKMTIREAHLCPAGRLVITDNQTGKTLDINEEPTILVIEDSMLGVHGPLGLRGNITVIDENQTPYEKRRLQALCRCGRSQNKPFCDGSHAARNESFQSQEDYSDTQ